MKLYGSEVSPFVRRVRYLLKHLNIPYEMVVMSLFETEGRELLDKHTKTKKIPFLIDEDKTLIDSWLITEYLLEKTDVSLDMPSQELQLINDANDSGVALYLVKKFELDPNWENRYSKNQLHRLNAILSHFEAQELDYENFKLKECWLFSMLEWLKIREVGEVEKNYPKLSHFLENCKCYQLP